MGPCRERPTIATYDDRAASQRDQAFVRPRRLCKTPKRGASEEWILGLAKVTGGSALESRNGKSSDEAYVLSTGLLLWFFHINGISCHACV